jgi:hypothetical protein
MSEAPLVFLHLSDIHFSRRSAAHYDLDRDLRDRVEADARAASRALPTITGILVSGDIAFSGQPNEYEVARAWLDALARNLGCTEENVWTVPGNHDVDRAAIKQSYLIRTLHRRLRPQNPVAVDQELDELHSDEEAFRSLHRPFAGYNAFAAPYRCVVGSPSLHWEDDLPLNDGSLLRLRGLNSALISNDSDDDSANRLVIGTQQSLPPRRQGVVYLTLCHHPPDWVWDRDQFTQNLNARVAVALFGHKHVQRIERVNDSLRVGSGALQPSRTEPGWLPRYNFITLAVTQANGARRLHVEIFQRVWSETAKDFLPDSTQTSTDRLSYDLPLEAWEAPPMTATAPPSGPTTTTAPLAVETPKPGPELRIMNPERRLTFRFLDLPYSRRIEVASALALVDDADEGISEDERYKRYFRRARERGALERFWEEVEKRHPDGAPNDNPFAKKG